MIQLPPQYYCPICDYITGEDHEICPACSNGKSIQYTNQPVNVPYRADILKWIKAPVYTLPILAALFLCSCATPEIASPKVGGTGFAVVDHSGYKFSEARYQAMLKAGAEEKYFYPYADAAYPHFLSSDNEPYVGAEMLYFRNKK